MEWVSSILAILASNQFRGIQVRFIEQFGGPNHWNGPKLGRLNIESFVTFLLNLASLRPRQRGLETTYSLHVIGRCLGTPKFKGEKDD